jgi:hypothetical protein
MKSLAELGKASNEFTTLEADEISSVAQNIISAKSSSRNFVGTTIGELMPEVKKLWKAGGRHLEAGCGVGNNLFQILTAFPKATAVGIAITLLEQTVRAWFNKDRKGVHEKPTKSHDNRKRD